MPTEEGSRGALTWGTRWDASGTVGDKSHGRYNPVVPETERRPGLLGKGWRQGQEPAQARGSTGKVRETGEKGPAFISGPCDLDGCKRCYSKKGVSQQLGAPGAWLPAARNNLDATQESQGHARPGENLPCLPQSSARRSWALPLPSLDLEPPPISPVSLGPRPFLSPAGTTSPFGPSLLSSPLGAP